MMRFSDMSISTTPVAPPPPVHSMPQQASPAPADNDNDATASGPARQPAPVANGTGKIIDLSA
jgi:hypothetical protein